MDQSLRPEHDPPPRHFLDLVEEPRGAIEPVLFGAKPGSGEVLLWWDIETCPLPGSATTRLEQELRRQAASNEVGVRMNVYGNVGPASKAGVEELLASGVDIQHRILPCKPHGLEPAVMTTLLVDLAIWALATPAPADVFIASAARDVSLRDLLGGLQKKHYNVFLATSFTSGNDTSQQQLFRPIPRHWCHPKLLFVARAAPFPGDSKASPDVKKLEQLHLHE